MKKVFKLTLSVLAIALVLAGGVKTGETNKVMPLGIDPPFGLPL